MTEAPVLIVGAGPAGLTLARILKARNVPFEVFERDTAIHFRRQGWAIALRSGIRRLMEMHPDEFGDIDSVSVNASNGLLDSGCVIDAVTDKKIGRIGGFPKGHPEYMLRARREGLRDYLSQGLDIHYDKNCIGYKEDDEGVTALFKDGSEFRGSILVGADGGMSHVRAQFLQHHHPEPAELVPVVGMLNLATKEEVEELQNIATAVFLMCTDTARMMVGVIDVAADRSHATAYIALCYKPEGVLEEEIKWAATASKEQLFQKAKEQTKDMPSKMQKYVDRVGVEGMVAPSLSFKEFMPPMALPESRVTLIGDSLHSMMPLRGAGANCSILDACDLGEILGNAEKRTARQDIFNLLKDYYRIACPRGRDEVAATHSAGVNKFMVLGIEDDLARQFAKITID